MALGEELVTNGGFDTDSDWDKNQWTISGGKANADGGVGYLTQDIGAQDDHTYQVVYTITDYTSGKVRIVIGGTSGTLRTSTGTYTEIITCGVLATVIFARDVGAGATFTGSIDDVSVKEITGVAQGFVG